MSLIQRVCQWFYRYVYEIQVIHLNPQIEIFLGIPSDMFVYPWLFILIIFISVFIIIPVILFISLYVTTLVMYVYRNRQTLNAKKHLKSKQGFRTFLHIVAMLWEAHGYFWHSYEVIGFENIPTDGPALIIYYHGVLPLDNFYLMTKVLLYKERLICSVGDHFLFMIPGSKILMRELKVLTGPVKECVRLLNEGNLLSIAPGGAREAIFGDNRYKLMWNNRTGFARVAIEAKVPIIPVFTQNLREVFIAVKWCRCILRPLYEWTRLPVVPFYGGFPVKLRTYVGEPIPYDPSLSVEQLALKTQNAIEELIQKHQKIPGNICEALTDRFTAQTKTNKVNDSKSK